MSDRDENLRELNWQLERLYEVGNSDVEFSLSRVADSIQSHQEGIHDLADAIRDGASNILAGLVVNAVITSRSKVHEFLIEFLINRAIEINKKTTLINSILRLQEKYPYLTFRLIMQRASVKGASTQERRDIINELINDDILVPYQHGKINALKIDPDGEELQDYWDWLDNLRDTLSRR